MKITTQRTVLWIVNFALVFCLLGFVILMTKNGRNARKAERTKAYRELEDRMRELKPRPPESAADAAAPKLNTHLLRNFHVAGYVPPPKPPPPKQAGPAKAPPLETLLEVIWVIAPRPGVSKDVAEGDGVIGASIKIKNLPNNQNVFWYREGDVIGIGENKRPDVQQEMKRFGGAKIVAIESDAIVCKWDDVTDARVAIGQFDEPGGLVISGKDISIGDPSALDTGGAGASGGSIQYANVSEGPRNTTNVSITQEGYRDLSDNGERVFDKIAVEKAKDANGKPALKIKSLPSELRDYGFQDGDVIVRIDNVQVSSKATVVSYVKRTHRQKSFYKVVVLRDGTQRSLNVKVPRNASKAARDLGRRSLRFGAGGRRNADKSR